MKTVTDSDRLAVIEEKVTRIDHNLFGNGQPGILEKFNSRLTKLENWRWWVVGILFGLGAALGASGKTILAAILKP